jgi:hypothetical protein
MSSLNLPTSRRGQDSPHDASQPIGVAVEPLGLSKALQGFKLVLAKLKLGADLTGTANGDRDLLAFLVVMRLFLHLHQFHLFLFGLGWNVFGKAENLFFREKLVKGGEVYAIPPPVEIADNRGFNGNPGV